jgi:hypothetical protein
MRTRARFAACIAIGALVVVTALAWRTPDPGRRPQDAPPAGARGLSDLGERALHTALPAITTDALDRLELSQRASTSRSVLVAALLAMGWLATSRPRPAHDGAGAAPRRRRAPRGHSGRSPPPGR